MKLLFIFAAILLAGTFAENISENFAEFAENFEENEPSLCVEHTNPFAYTHCIRKRDTGCQNGGFCGSCNSNSCQTCNGNGNSCKTSCNGAACNSCPNGNCCNGQNCNVCSGKSCCSSQGCNSCVNSCNEGCSSPACKSSCFQTCQGGSCCDKSECFNSCRNQCFGDHCYENCFKQCSCPQTCNNPPSDPIIQPNISVPVVPQQPQNSNQTIVIVNKPENKNPVNITTIVNLRNYINNKNIINTPINVTNINHNHINESQPAIPKPEPVKDKCCMVVYPVHCYDISEAPYKKCIQKREKKCGEICTSVVVHVVHVPGKDREVQVPYPVPVQVPGPVQVVRQNYPYPVPVVQRYPVYVPQPQPSPCGGGVVGGGVNTGTTGGCGGYRPVCHYINRYPWVSCSNYGVQNCGSCYVCGGQYNPGHCSQQVGCAGLCRGGIVNFGNNWQNDILRYSSNYNTPYNTQFAQFSAQVQSQPQVQPQQPPAELQQAPADIQQVQQIQQLQQPYAQPQVDIGAQQQFVQQPVDLGLQQQQYVQQPMEFHGGVQQQYVQHPYDVQQQGVQQFVVPQPYDLHQGGHVVQQQLPMQVQQHPGFVGK